MTDREDTRYVWIVDGEPHVGTVDQYARDWESGHYTGIPVSRGMWKVSIAWELMACEVAATYDGTDSNDYMLYTLTVEDTIAYVAIDGRA